MIGKKILVNELETLDKYDSIKPLPQYIEMNLAEHINLRDYQKKAIQYFITNYDKKSNIEQIHNLFYMATGSGKTVIMAGLILYLYTQGYRNFLFFVNQTNIVEKTKDNFLHKNSSKYLFADTLEYAGRKISINEVSNFANIDPLGENINIHFTSIQKLHLDLQLPKENSITFDDFEENDIVFLSDESHHINSMTKSGLTAEEKEAEKSWEYSVLNAFNSNVNHILLDFTATVDINDENVRKKYKEKIIFDYSLKKFRKSGYTKDFKNFSTDSDYWSRALIASVMSEYRRHLFAEAGQNIKPVMMFQSYRVQDSEDFYIEYFKKMNELSTQELENLYNYDIKDLNEALNFFRKLDSNLTLNFLRETLQSSFTIDKAMIVNRKRDSDSVKNQRILNSLEDSNNPIRIVFTVKMLIEGWDVLNLFDIVRLHDQRTSKNYTMSEAQLIGRGARYFPFQVEAEQEKSKRKYDGDLDNPYRYLETMYFHSNNDSRYISELREALIETGMRDEKPIEVRYELKDVFKESDFYKTGLVFSNKRLPKDRTEIRSIEENQRIKIHKYTQKSYSGYVGNLMTGGIERLPTVDTTKNVERMKFKEIPYNILLGVVERHKELTFSELKYKYPNLKTLREFLTSDAYLGNNILELTYYQEYHVRDIFDGLMKAMDNISDQIISIKQEYQGSREFEPQALYTVVKDKSIYLNEIVENGGIGSSQNTAWDTDLQLDLFKEDWYVFNDNYGTRDEKRFLLYFKDHIAPRLDEKKLEYYVVRNERFSDLANYSFKDGERFEPDFLLFIRGENLQTKEITQVYIEPKGTHLLEYDSWKEGFLLKVQEEAIVSKMHQFAINYDLIGLPFFNEENNIKMIKFNEAIENLLKKI